MPDGIGDMKLLPLINFGALYNFMSSSVAKHFGRAIKPNNTPVAVKLANRTVVCSSSVANGLVLNCVWQANVVFLVLDVPFEVALDMPWLSHICPQLDYRTRELNI